jgi:ribosomal protein S18 acetylase RimI-like enzyme
MQITIRKRQERDIAGIARVRIDAWRAAYHEIVPEEYLAGLSYAADEARLLQRYRDTNGDQGVFFFAAVDETQQVVGFGVGGAEREGYPGYPGELYALYVHPDWQGQGIGKQLAQAVFTSLHAAGLEPVLIWALKENVNAGDFYRRLGGVPAGEKEIEIGGKKLVEVGFGFVRVNGEEKSANIDP